MREVKILPIYEEDIIGFVFDGFSAQFKYYHENSKIELRFDGTYLFDFCEFEYINDVDCKFGLFEYVESPLLTDLFSRIIQDKIDYAFGGEIEKIRHYKLVIDDVGVYNIVCKQFVMEQTENTTKTNI